MTITITAVDKKKKGLQLLLLSNTEQIVVNAEPMVSRQPTHYSCLQAKSFYYLYTLQYQNDRVGHNQFKIVQKEADVRSRETAAIVKQKKKRHVRVK